MATFYQSDDELTTDAVPSPPRRSQKSRNETSDSSKKSASSNARQLPQNSMYLPVIFLTLYWFYFRICKCY